MSMRKVTLFVQSDGRVQGLHTDHLDLASLGCVRRRRASHVEPDDDRQVWYVEDADTGERIFEHPSRRVCLEWEEAHFNQMLAVGYQPFEEKR